MFCTAGLPHVRVRVVTVPKVSDARPSAGYALVVTAILNTTAPAVASFARTNLVDTVHNTAYADAPEWFGNWETTGLVAWQDKNNDGLMQYGPGSALSPAKPQFDGETGSEGERLLKNQTTESINAVYIDRKRMD